MFSLEHFTLDQFTHKATTILSLSFLAFLVAMLITPLFTYYSYKYKLWKQPRTHDATGQELKVINKLRIKRTLPRMGGLITLVAVVAVTFAFNLDRRQTWLPIAAFLGGGIVGLMDDIINIRGAGGKVAGLRAPIKLALITAVAAIGAWFFYFKLDYHSVQVPFVGDFNLGLLLIPLFILAVISTSNAVNFTDGVDGLAGGLLLNAYTAFGIIAALQGYFGIAAFCMTIVGALLAYLWFNIPPARFIMGDVGSFSLGTALGVVAMLTDTLLLLPLICLPFVLEGGSSLIQIASKKLFHRKVFIAAPIHHHLEAMGWPKTKVTMRFWVIGQACGALGIILALVGGYIN